MPIRMSVDRYRRREQHFWLTALTADAALPAAVDSVAPAPRRGLPLLALALAARRLLLRLSFRSGLRPYRVLHAAEAGVRQARDAVVGIEQDPQMRPLMALLKYHFDGVGEWGA